MNSKNKTDKLIREAIKLRREGEPEKSIEILSSLFDEDSQNPAITGLLAGTFFSMQEYDLALKFYQKTVDINPKSEAATAGLFHCLNELNQFTDGVEHILMFMESTDLKKNHIKWILEDLMNDIDHRLLENYQVRLRYFAELYLPINPKLND